jgi:hypothetical protein
LEIGCRPKTQSTTSSITDEGRVVKVQVRLIVRKLKVRRPFAVLRASPTCPD